MATPWGEEGRVKKTKKRKRNLSSGGSQALFTFAPAPGQRPRLGQGPAHAPYGVNLCCSGVMSWDCPGKHDPLQTRLTPAHTHRPVSQSTQGCMPPVTNRPRCSASTFDILYFAEHRNTSPEPVGSPLVAPGCAPRQTCLASRNPQKRRRPPPRLISVQLGRSSPHTHTRPHHATCDPPPIHQP